MMAVPRVAVFGGRDFRDESVLAAALDRLLAERGPFVVVHGACRTGADAMAERWAKARGLGLDPHPADWAKLGKVGGFIRNRTMAESGLAGAVGFPGGAGTRDMAAACKSAGVPVWWPCGGQP